MLIQLPAETWIEILDWLRRRDFVKKLDKLWDRQFTPLVQDWLHKYTKNVKIGRLLANKNDGLSVCVGNNWEKVPFAEVELPENVTNFKRIEISYVDSTLLTFLRRMRPLLRNIYLDIYTENDAPTPTALHHLMPLIGEQIGSIDSDSEWLPFFSDNFRDVLFNARLLCIWFFKSHTNSEQMLLNWLFTRCEDGQPRILVFRAWEIIGDFGTKLRQRFLDPARQLTSPFFVRIDYIDDYEPLPIPSTSENTRTGDQLTARKVEHGTENFVLITNCAIGMDGEWLAKKTKEVLDWNAGNQQQSIVFGNSPEIGPLDVEDQQLQLADDHGH